MSLTFEASFSKAMRLLQSPNKDATEQLKAMLDECLALKKGPTPVVPKQQPAPIKPVITNKVTPAPAVSAPSIIVPSDDDIECTSISCVVCKRADQTVGNEIVECQECHSLYHQECHKPSLANENVKDPRFVWYCSTCTNRRKKAKLPGKTPTTTAIGNGNTSKDSKEQKDPEISPFKSWSFLKK